MRIGVLTAGGDAPGLNAAVRALGRRALADGHVVMGVSDGWSGLVSDDGQVQQRPLSRVDLAGILASGGTVLGSVRCNLDDPAGGRERVLSNIFKNFDALVAMGGDGTMRIAQWLNENGARIVGVPKTLDNDLCATEYCIGFDTAVGIVSEALDRLHTTAASHHRVMVLETMGRSTGWVAALGGLAGGADFVVIPEFPVTLEDVVTHVRQRHESGRAFSIVVVAEGVRFGSTSNAAVPKHKAFATKGSSRGIGHVISEYIRRATGFETRATVLGYVQRGGTPSAHDRVWATYVGSAAYDAVRDEAWGMIPVVQNGSITRVDIKKTIEKTHVVPRELYELCAHFF